ncbi:unnamed protein product [Gulo gulo]|uniref:Uncharacterized protein n=1 Tax=Gulo gulo TaxID=48420 RepID=A0A9X9Q6V1_GULGU|nr:unnamed protein product [Gulo gulo]
MLEGDVCEQIPEGPSVFCCHCLCPLSFCLDIATLKQKEAQSVQE